MAQESPSTEIREEIATQLAQLKPLEDEHFLVGLAYAQLNDIVTVLRVRLHVMTSHALPRCEK